MQWRPCLCNLKLFVYFVYEVFYPNASFFLVGFLWRGVQIGERIFCLLPPKKWEQDFHEQLWDKSLWSTKYHCECCNIKLCFVPLAHHKVILLAEKIHTTPFLFGLLDFPVFFGAVRTKCFHLFHSTVDQIYRRIWSLVYNGYIATSVELHQHWTLEWMWFTCTQHDLYLLSLSLAQNRVS